ncbi:MAG TPA: NUDIX domain-containing protein [Candidatus Saccharimonadales bacterium]|nr:NUDIX domain-containing protein [Candidatus Saccharimonadales bacterium]
MSAHAERIRPVALCVLRRDGRMLVMEGKDPLSREPFLRPLGGTVEFGERAEEAVRREILEELGEEIGSPRRLGVLENIFHYGGRTNHEIVFVFEAEFRDPGVYEREHLEAVEADGTPLKVRWVESAAIGAQGPPLYPAGLDALVGLAPAPGSGI